MCVQFADKRRRVEVVDEGSPAVDLDHRQPFPVALLELRDAGDVHLFELELMLGAHLCERRLRALAEMAAFGVIENDPRHACARRSRSCRPRAEPGFARREPSIECGRPPKKERAHGETMGSPMRLGIEPPRHGRLGDALDREPVGGEAHRQVA